MQAEYLSVRWRPWQLLCMSRWITNRRAVHWVFDLIGNTGKSFLARYMSLCGALVFSSTKKADVFNVIQKDRDCTYFVFDFSRCQAEYVNYSTIEEIKNGLIFASKYDSNMFALTIPNVVVCFANFEPDLTKLSADRWVCTTVSCEPRRLPRVSMPSSSSGDGPLPALPAFFTLPAAEGDHIPDSDPPPNSPEGVGHDDPAL